MYTRIIPSDKDIESLAIILEELSIHSDNSLTYTQEKLLNSLRILIRLSSIQLKYLYLRIWRDSHANFVNMFSISINEFLEWLRQKSDNTIEQKCIGIIITYFKTLLNRESIKRLDNINTLKYKLEISHPLNIVFLDYDNLSPALDIFIKTLPDDNCNTMVIAFVSNGTHRDNLTIANTKSWFTMVRANYSVKDAADHCMSMSMCLANQIVNIGINFYIATLDKFSIEVISQLIKLESRRKFIYLNLNNIPNYLDKLSQKLIIVSKTNNNYIEKVTDQIIPNTLNDQIPDDTLFVNFETRFDLFCELVLLYSKENNTYDILLSLLGTYIKHNGLYADRGGLKELINRFCLLNLGILKGKMGTSTICICIESLIIYLNKK